MSGLGTGVGQSVGRLDGIGKVTGKALYVDDISVEGVLYGATVRSEVPRGKLRAIVWDPAFDWSDIVRVTADDIPGDNVVTLIVDDQPVLAHDTINHATEPVALIACADRARLHDALGHVTLDIEPLEPVYDIKKSEVVMCDLSLGKGDVDAGFAEATHVLEHEYFVSHQEQMYIEPQGMLADVRPDGGVKVTGSLQCPYYIHKALKRIHVLDDSQVEVIQAVTGGGFGGKEEYPSIIAAHATLLARKAGRPVKIIYDRAEDIASTTKRHPCLVRIKHGFREDGTITAVQAGVIMDGGAYATLSKVVLSRAIIHAVGPYECDNVKVHGTVVQTHTPPNGAFRGFGAPQTTWAYERQLDRGAAACGITPLEIRSRNRLRDGGETATGQKLTVSVGSDQVWDEGLRMSDYVQRRAEIDALDQPGPIKRGIGMSFFFHGDGFTGGGDERMESSVELDLRADGQLVIRTASTEIGQGLRTIFPQIVAETLGIPVERVEFAETNTQTVPDSGPTVASRSTMIVGKVLEWCAEELRGRLEDGPITVAKSYKGPGGQFWDEETYSGDAYPCYSWAVDVAVVTVDTDTGEVQVEELWLAQDIGKAINPVMCEGQIEGGTLQGVGYLHLEQVVMKDGRPWNDRMTNYIIPTSLDSPVMHTSLVEVAYPHGPFGAKGVGELPMDGVGPAIAAAIEHATGAFITQQPTTPEMLLDLLNEAAEVRP